MKVFFHFSVAGFSNTYIVGPDSGGDAIIIDPGTMNVALLNMIEANGFYIRHVLVTHSHDSHTSGLRTLRKIYDFDIYAGTPEIKDYPCNQITGGDAFEVADVLVKAISVGGHSSDSLVYVINSWLFTGDVFGAGTLGSTPNGYAKELMITEIKKKIFSLENDYLIFPGHGAPSTLEIEKLTNPALIDRSTD
ncbi:MAG: MBL fold metallo-hydrolase [Spirochaetales bacterium]|nr:MBL fold metallo-hydrolase [Spirochaetales bacterium]